jgi:tetratricopeptide (TPR) repeat protein
MAEDNLRAALALREKAGEGDGLAAARTRMDIAVLLLQTHRAEQAVPLLEGAVATMRHAPGTDPHLLAYALMWLARLRPAEQAAATLDEAVDVLQEAGLENDAMMGAALVNRARLAQAAGDLDRAESCLRRAIDRYAATRGTDSMEVASARHALADVLLALDRPEEAETEIEAALEPYQRRLPKTSIRLLDPLDIGRRVAVANESWPLAERHARAIVATLLVQPRPDDARIASALFDLGNARAKAGDTDGAVESLTDALERMGDTEPHPQRLETLVLLAERHANRGEGATAREYFGRAQELLPEGSSPLRERIERGLSESR